MNTVKYSKDEILRISNQASSRRIHSWPMFLFPIYKIDLKVSSPALKSVVKVNYYCVKFYCLGLLKFYLQQPNCMQKVSLGSMH